MLPGDVNRNFAMISQFSGLQTLATKSSPTDAAKSPESPLYAILFI